jgi:hypothetical protein
MNKTEFKKLISSPISTLKNKGFMQFDEPSSDGKALFLIPGKLYNEIPDGFKAITIGGKEMVFKKGKSDNDMRYGCLSYGILKNIKKKQKK